MKLMCLDDFFLGHAGGELPNTVDHQTKKDDAYDCKWEDESATWVIIRRYVSKTYGQDRDIGKIEGIGVTEATQMRENSSAAGEPNEKHHGLKNKRSLVVVKVEMLGVVTEKISKHVDH
jgi:hypothetical protein